MTRTYTLTMRIDGKDDLTQDQIYDTVYDLLHAAPFFFDVTNVEAQAKDQPRPHASARTAA